MIPSLGSKKKENLPTMDRHTEELPQLSNEMQLIIMNKVKSGELSIEDALKLAKQDEKLMLEQKNQREELQDQYNFSVHKHNRYRWQKRVFQIDFKTHQLCSIEKGIVKRQIPFSTVKSCDDAPGSKFSISFRGHHDYELEATSVEDKHKMIQLLNQIIHRNIYSDPEEGQDEEPEASRSLREGVMLLHRGGLASFRWVKYEVTLLPDQLVLRPLKHRRPSLEGPVSEPRSTVIHLSDGDTSVQTAPSADAFTLITHKNQYQFRMMVPAPASPSTALQNERDAWVEAIHKLCLEWKRKSTTEDAKDAEDDFPEMTSLRNISITEERENTISDLESSGSYSNRDTIPVFPAVDNKIAEPTIIIENPNPPSIIENPNPPTGEGGLLTAIDTSQTLPVAKSRTKRPLPLAPSSPVHPSPPPTPVRVPPTVPEPVTDSGSVEVSPPLPPSIPAPPLPPPVPPPLPIKKRYSGKTRTKVFHWDVVGLGQIEKSLWTQESRRNVEIDTGRLLDQFAVRNLVGVTSVAESSQTQNIMLSEKVAHNFNIFLKSFPVQPGELKDKLFVVSEGDGGLSDEHISTLRRYVPTVDDIEMYKSHRGPVTELHIVDQYMMEMCHIPSLSSQLDLLLTLRELPETMSDLQPLINQKIRMCTELNNSRSFVSVLEYLLAIGNYLNENAGKQKAKGIRLSSLAKLSQLRGRDTKFTLLHALVEQIMLHEAWLATFTQELAEFETVPGASIKGLTAEVDVLKREVQKVIQYSRKFRKGNSEHPKFSKDLKMVIDKYNISLTALTKMCEEMKRSYSAILVKFGEPADQDSRELFGLICQFIHDFKRVRAEII
ncbi:uncharacterized protein [Antennarius striatus]|uniref:uncharacterized protein n=1 Tax=Antennarius striatus TaxID=241820 RepID=UPI0035ADDA4A